MCAASQWGQTSPAHGQALTEALADRLEQAAEQSGLPAWDERGVCDLVAERGVSWLLTPRQPKTDSADVLVMSPADHLAVVGLLAQLRAEWEATEATALARAHEAGASWTDIGTALGVSRQSAHARARRRSTGTPTRLSTQH